MKQETCHVDMDAPEGIVRLVPRPPREEQISQRINEEAVRIARHMLEMAERGEIRHLVVAYETEDRYDGEGTGVDIAKHVGMLDLVRFKFMYTQVQPVE